MVTGLPTSSSVKINRVTNKIILRTTYSAGSGSKLSKEEQRYNMVDIISLSKVLDVHIFKNCLFLINFGFNID